MRSQQTLFLVASVALCAWPLQAAAQDDQGFELEEGPAKEPAPIYTSTVELGLGWVSTDSFKFGEYSGLTDEGPFGIANFDILMRSPYDGPSTEYWDFSGSNLALDSRAAHLEYGEQGRFSLFLDFSQIPHFATDDARTPYLGAGSTNLTLPPLCTGGSPVGTAPGPGQTTCWDPSLNTPASSTAVPNPNMTQLDADLNDVNFKTKRTRFGGGFTWVLNKEWSVGGSFTRENKDGLETIAGLFAASGGSPRAALLPKPIDYTTQDADVYLTYQGENLRAQFNYHLSLFDDKVESLTWQNPYDRATAWDADQGFSTGGFGRMALEPDNMAHTGTLSLGYTLDPTTRLAGNFSYSRMLQDETFLPYSTTGFGVNGIAFGAPPRNSLEGDVTKLHGALSLVTQIAPDLDLKTQYTFDDHDNNTPTDIFCVVRSDSLNQNVNCDGAALPDSLNTADARINRPYSRREHNFAADATYQLLSDTKVILGYVYETINRDLTEVENTYEHKGSIKLKSSPFSFATGSLEYSYSDRTGSDYISNQPLLVTHSLAFIATEGGATGFFEANPYMRKFYIADRARHFAKAALTLSPSDEISVGLLGSIDRSDFPDTIIGLTQRDYDDATVDVTYTPSKDITVSGFFSYDRLTNEQTGYERGSAPPLVPGDPLLPARLWDVNTLDQGYTAGAEAEWAAIEDTLKLAFSYTYSHTVTEYAFAGDPTLLAEPVPDVVSIWHSFGIRADYTMSEGVIGSLGYRFETFDNDDFALDSGSSVPAVIMLGTQSLDYNSAHVVAVSLRKRF